MRALAKFLFISCLTFNADTCLDTMRDKGIGGAWMIQSYLESYTDIVVPLCINAAE